MAILENKSRTFQKVLKVEMRKKSKHISIKELYIWMFERFQEVKKRKCAKKQQKWGKRKNREEDTTPCPHRRYFFLGFLITNLGLSLLLFLSLSLLLLKRERRNVLISPSKGVKSSEGLNSKPEAGRSSLKHWVCSFLCASS